MPDRDITIADIIKDTIILSLRKFYSKDLEFTYVNDDKQTNVIISDAYSVSLEDIEKKPAIVLNRAIISAKEMGMGKAGYNFKTGESTYLYQYNCQVEINNIATKGLVAERLANKTGSFFLGNRKALKKLGFIQILTVAIGGETPQAMSMQEELVVVPVIINTIFASKFTEKIIGVELTEVDINEIGEAIWNLIIRK